MTCSMFDVYTLPRALLHDLEIVMAALNLSDDERSVVVRALGMLAASMRRSAKSASSEELRQIYERDASRVDALATKFR